MKYFRHTGSHYFLTVALVLSARVSIGKINVLTTTSTLRSIVQTLGGDRIEVTSIAKGTQDPHYVEPKPSYMLLARKADLMVLVGLDLEIGWLPNVIRGSRNPGILPGKPGYFDSGSLIEPIEVPTGTVDRSQGDIHPGGNPHFLLDPVRVKTIAEGIAQRLSTLDPEGAQAFTTAKVRWLKELDGKVTQWRGRLSKSGVKQVITYHRTLNYFLARFGISLAGEVEPKPGIPPTAKHIMDLISVAKEKKVPCVLIESFFEPGPAEKIHSNAGARIIIVPTEVDAMNGAGSYELLIERLVAGIEQCGLRIKEG